MKSKVLKTGGWTSMALAFLLASLVGCLQEKQSLHEDDHHVPAHWPNNILDAAQKIEDRLATLEADAGDDSAQKQLTELVEWTPEIAADTDLTEPDWIPIYEMCETIRRHMLVERMSPSEIRGDFERLIGLLRDSDTKLNSE